MEKMQDSNFNWTSYLPEDGDDGPDNCANVARLTDEYVDAVFEINHRIDMMEEARKRVQNLIIQKFTPAQIEKAHELYNRAHRKNKTN